MTYSLKMMAIAKNIRRKRIVFRKISITQAFIETLRNIVSVPVDAWVTKVNQQILPAYDTALSRLIKDSAEDDFQTAMAAAQSDVQSIIVQAGLSGRLAGYLARVNTWHSEQWNAAVKAKTGINVYPYVDLYAARPTLNVFQLEISSLITNIDDVLRQQISTIVWQGVLERTPRNQIGKQIAERIGVARSRANFIASDQANKLAGRLDQFRQEEAGLGKYQWKGTADSRERPTHVANNDKIFSWDKPPPVTGHPKHDPRCRCSALGVLELD